MSTVGGTLVVEFGENANSSEVVVVELDDTLNGDVSTFAPGQSAYFWVHHGPSVRVGTVTAPAGVIAADGGAQRNRTEEVTWTNLESQELQCIPAATPTVSWTGAQGSGFAVNGRKASVTGNVPCTCEVSYPIDVHLYHLIPPPLDLADGETFRIVIVVYMEGAV